MSPAVKAMMFGGRIPLSLRPSMPDSNPEASTHGSGPGFSKLYDGANVAMMMDGGNDTEPEGEANDTTPEDSPGKVTKSSPKKRAAANAEAEDTSPKKKRVPAKGKAATATDIERPSTPEPQTSKEPKTPKTPKSPAEDNIVQANDITPKPARAKTHPSKPKPAPKPSPAKGKRAGAEKVAEKVVLPTKWSEASTADKKLVEMKEAGKAWSEIRGKWLEMTGQDTASSTLPNR
ncbi:MAG: hypothetical protein Q9213_005646 [Squamulea squamosa]